MTKQPLYDYAALLAARTVRALTGDAEAQIEAIEMANSSELSSFHCGGEVTRGYVFDEASRLYRPVAGGDRGSDARKPDNSDRAPKPGVIVLHDWFSVIVSILTLALLATTGYYTRQQWKSVNEQVAVARRTLQLSEGPI